MHSSAVISLKSDRDGIITDFFLPLGIGDGIVCAAELILTAVKYDNSRFYSFSAVSIADSRQTDIRYMWDALVLQCFSAYTAFCQEKAVLLCGCLCYVLLDGMTVCAGIFFDPFCIKLDVILVFV